MEQAFDHIAADYDSSFTHSEIGKRQRRSVWSYLDRFLSGQSGLNILELNCGTGEDAVHMAEMGHRVMATDASEGMLSATRRKAAAHDLSDRIRTRPLAFEDITSENLIEHRFDLVFSNFGGLNCIDRQGLSRLAGGLASITGNNAHCILVVMPDRCAMESLYFLSRLKTGSAFRRNSRNPVAVNVDGKAVPTWYHSPAVMRAAFEAHGWEWVANKPVGLFVPPSYLEPFFAKRTRLLNRLERWEQPWYNRGAAARWADHYLIDFRKRA